MKDPGDCEESDDLSKIVDSVRARGLSPRERNINRSEDSANIKKSMLPGRITKRPDDLSGIINVCRTRADDVAWWGNGGVHTTTISNVRVRYVSAVSVLTDNSSSIIDTGSDCTC